MPRTLLINSTLAAIIGTTIMVFLHECAHFLTTLALGHSASINAFSATHSEDLPPTHIALIAAAGPIFSLLSGIICSLLQPRRLVWTGSALLPSWKACVISSSRPLALVTQQRLWMHSVGPHGCN